MYGKQEKLEDVKLEEAIEIAGYGKFSMFIILLSGLAGSSSYLGSIDVGYIISTAECDLELTSHRKGVLGSAFFLGVMLTCHLTGFLADTLGRRYVLLRSLWLNVIMYILGTFAPNFWLFTLSKLFSGMVLGPCLVASYPFLGEYVPASRRTQALILSFLLASMALFHTTLIGWLTLQQVWHVDLWFIQFTPWRLYFLLCGLPSLLGAVLFYITPESPKFLMSRGKKGDTIKVLERVHSINSGKLPQSYTVGSVVLDDHETIAPSRQKGAMGILKLMCDQTLALLERPYLKNLMLCIIMGFMANLFTNNIMLWLPEITNRIVMHKNSHEEEAYVCEMMAHSDYNKTEGMLQKCDRTVDSDVFLTNLIIAVAQLFYTIAFFFIAPVVNKRAVATLVMLICSLLMFLITNVTNTTVMIALFGSSCVVISVVFNVITNVVIELFPTYIRALALSVVLIFGRIGAIVGSHMFSELIDSQCSILFYTIAGMLLCSSVAPLCINLKRTKSAELKTENGQQTIPDNNKTSTIELPK